MHSIETIAKRKLQNNNCVVYPTQYKREVNRLKKKIELLITYSIIVTVLLLNSYGIIQLIK